jgi:hypothetical protein
MALLERSLSLGGRARALLGTWFAGPSSPRRRPVVLCVVQSPGLGARPQDRGVGQGRSARSFEIVKRFHGDVTAGDIERADCVLLLYFWLQLEQLPHLQDALRNRRDRLMIGICSHYELTRRLAGAGTGHARRAGGPRCSSTTGSCWRNSARS